MKKSNIFILLPVLLFLVAVVIYNLKLKELYDRGYRESFMNMGVRPK